MLTLILLVVLAGFAGIVAVSAAEKQHPATPEPRLPGGPDGAGNVDDAIARVHDAATDGVLVDDFDGDVDDDVVTGDHEGRAESRPAVHDRTDGQPILGPTRGALVASTGIGPTGAAPRTAGAPVLPRRRTTSLPSRVVAVEGPFHVVAQRSWWRRLRAATSIGVLTVVLGFTVAGVLGLVGLVVASMLDRAIG